MEGYAEMSRKKDLEKMASLVGNSAAHAALYPDDTARREIAVYYDDAYEIASSRTWNRQEIEYFRAKARGRAEREIEKRGFDRVKFIEKADAYIENFIQENM